MILSKIYVLYYKYRIQISRIKRPISIHRRIPIGLKIRLFYFTNNEYYSNPKSYLI